MKKPANDENRIRMDDQYHRRPTPPDRMPSPRDTQHRSISEAQRLEDQRRANESYHPSEAAHHPPTIPAMNHAPPPHLVSSQTPSQPSQLSQPPPLPPMSDAPKEERPREHEPAIRPMDVDENYDDDGEEDKKMGPSAQFGADSRGLPGANGASNGMANGQPKVEPVA